MATPFTPKKIVLSEINGGNQLENGDTPSKEVFNAPIEASAYAQQVAEDSKNISNTALSTANGIDGKATQALSNSENAISTSTEAKNIAQEALDAVVSGGGTAIDINGDPITQLSFNSDPQTQLNNLKNKYNLLNSKKILLKNLDVIFKVNNMSIDFNKQIVYVITNSSFTDVTSNGTQYTFICEFDFETEITKSGYYLLEWQLENKCTTYLYFYANIDNQNIIFEQLECFSLIFDNDNNSYMTNTLFVGNNTANFCIVKEPNVYYCKKLYITTNNYSTVGATGSTRTIACKLYTVEI